MEAMAKILRSIRLFSSMKMELNVGAKLARPFLTCRPPTKFLRVSEKRNRGNRDQLCNHQSQIPSGTSDRSSLGDKERPR